MQIITKMGSGTILKNKKFCKDQKQFFFYRDQNLNGPYLQGQVQYLSLKFIKGGLREWHVSHSSKVAGKLQEAKEFTSLQNDERSSKPRLLIFKTCF